MKRQPGDRQMQDNRAHTAALGGTKSNGVANAFLSELRNKRVRVVSNQQTVKGVLIAFDAYSMLVKQAADGCECLIFKGPGCTVIEDNEL